MVSSIAVDLTPAITGATGIARYVQEVAARMAAEPDIEVRGFALGRALRPVPPDTRHVRVPLRVVDAVWRAVGWPRLDRITGSVASVHASGPVLPPAGAPIVAIVHDLAAIDHPHLHPPRDVAQLRRYVAELHRAAAVIAVSQTTARRLAAEVDPSRIHVVPQGVATLPAAEDPPLVGQRYLLTVGSAVPRKRYDAVIRALPSLDPDVRLVLVGPAGPEDRALAELSRSLGVADRVHQTGEVSDGQLAGWYQHAAAVVAPSIEEGFGLPLVEALAAGSVVVASDLPVHREVTGDAAVFAAVDDDDALRDALATALERGSAVDDLRARGARHAARYSWDACAQATLAVHRSVW